MMKREYMMGLAVAALLAGGATVNAAADTAAKVNGVEITADKVQRSTDAYLREKNVDVAAVRDGEQYRTLQQQVLEVLIGQELLWQDAQDKGMVASDEEVAKALDSVRGQYPDAQTFTARLQENNLSEQEFADDLKRRLSVRKLISESIAKELEVSDEEVHAYYEQNPESFIQPEEVHLRHVLIKTSDDMDEAARAQAKKKIEAVLEQANGGADFAELAKQHSEGPTGPRGGDLGFVRQGQLVKPFEDAAFALQPGGVSGVVETVYGYHIIKMEERRGGAKVAEAEVADKVRAFLLNQKGQEALRKRVEDLRGAAAVEISGG